MLCVTVDHRKASIFKLCVNHKTTEYAKHRDIDSLCAWKHRGCYNGEKWQRSHRIFVHWGRIFEGVHATSIFYIFSFLHLKYVLRATIQAGLPPILLKRWKLSIRVVPSCKKKISRDRLDSILFNPLTFSMPNCRKKNCYCVPLQEAIEEDSIPVPLDEVFPPSRKRNTKKVSQSTRLSNSQFFSCLD